MSHGPEPEHTPSGEPSSKPYGHRALGFSDAIPGAPGQPQLSTGVNPAELRHAIGGELQQGVPAGIGKQDPEITGGALSSPAMLTPGEPVKVTDSTVGAGKPRDGESRAPTKESLFQSAQRHLFGEGLQRARYGSPTGEEYEGVGYAYRAFKTVSTPTGDLSAYLDVDRDGLIGDTGTIHWLDRNTRSIGFIDIHCDGEVSTYDYDGVSDREIAYWELTGGAAIPNDYLVALKEGCIATEPSMISVRTAEVAGLLNTTQYHPEMTEGAFRFLEEKFGMEKIDN